VRKLSWHIIVQDWILVKSSMHLEMRLESAVRSAGQGVFSVQEDHSEIGNLMQQVISRSLLASLKQANFTRYRLILNQQHVRLRGFENQSLDDVLGVVPETDPCEDVLSKFLIQNGFRKFDEWDSMGWSPLCYASVKGDVSLLNALVAARADPNQKTRRKRPEASIDRRCPVP